MARFRITQRNVIGHAESISSPYHHELVAALRTQTHGDWNARDAALPRVLERK
jgi:beta-N-acetylhexosaminidase